MKTSTHPEPTSLNQEPDVVLSPESAMELPGRKVESARRPESLPTNLPAEGRNSLEAVRDLLFGHQVQQLEGQISASHQFLLGEIGAQAAALGRSVQDAVGLSREATAETQKRIEAERGERMGALERQGERLGVLEARLEEKVTKLGEEFRQETQQLRESLTARIMELDQRMTQLRGEVLSRLEQQIGALGEATVKRSALAEMLVELASKTSGKA